MENTNDSLKRVIKCGKCKAYLEGKIGEKQKCQACGWKE